jgi:hypothetical protein
LQFLKLENEKVFLFWNAHQRPSGVLLSLCRRTQSLEGNFISLLSLSSFRLSEVLCCQTRYSIVALPDSLLQPNASPRAFSLLLTCPRNRLFADFPFTQLRMNRESACLTQRDEFPHLLLCREAVSTRSLIEFSHTEM